MTPKSLWHQRLLITRLLLAASCNETIQTQNTLSCLHAYFHRGLNEEKTFQFLYGFVSVWEHFPEFSLYSPVTGWQTETGGWWVEFYHTAQCWDGLHWRQRNTLPATTTTREQQTSCRSFWRRRRRRRRRRICCRRWSRREDKVADNDRLHCLLLQQILQRTPGPLYADILLLYVLQSNPNIYNNIFLKNPQFVCTETESAQ